MIRSWVQSPAPNKKEEEEEEKKFLFFKHWEGNYRDDIPWRGGLLVRFWQEAGASPMDLQSAFHGFKVMSHYWVLIAP